MDPNLLSEDGAAEILRRLAEGDVVVRQTGSATWLLGSIDPSTFPTDSAADIQEPPSELVESLQQRLQELTRGFDFFGLPEDQDGAGGPAFDMLDEDDEDGESEEGGGHEEEELSPQPAAYTQQEQQQGATEDDGGDAAGSAADAGRVNGQKQAKPKGTANEDVPEAAHARDKKKDMGQGASGNENEAKAAASHHGDDADDDGATETRKKSGKPKAAEAGEADEDSDTSSESIPHTPKQAPIYSLSREENASRVDIYEDPLPDRFSNKNRACDCVTVPCAFCMSTLCEKSCAEATKNGYFLNACENGCARAECSNCGQEDDYRVCAYCDIVSCTSCFDALDDFPLQEPCDDSLNLPFYSCSDCRYSVCAACWWMESQEQQEVIARCCRCAKLLCFRCRPRNDALGYQSIMPECWDCGRSFCEDCKSQSFVVCMKKTQNAICDFVCIDCRQGPCRKCNHTLDRQTRAKLHTKQKARRKALEEGKIRPYVPAFGRQRAEMATAALVGDIAKRNELAGPGKAGGSQPSQHKQHHKQQHKQHHGQQGQRRQGKKATKLNLQEQEALAEAQAAALILEEQQAKQRSTKRKAKKKKKKAKGSKGSSTSGGGGGGGNGGGGADSAAASSSGQDKNQGAGGAKGKQHKDKGKGKNKPKGGGSNNSSSSGGGGGDAHGDAENAGAVKSEAAAAAAAAAAAVTVAGKHKAEGGSKGTLKAGDKQQKQSEKDRKEKERREKKENKDKEEKRKNKKRDNGNRKQAEDTKASASQPSIKTEIHHPAKAIAAAEAGLKTALDARDLPAIEAFIAECTDLGVPVASASKTLRRLQRAEALRKDLLAATEAEDKDALIAVLRRTTETSKRISCLLAAEIEAALEALDELPEVIRPALAELLPGCDSILLLPPSQRQLHTAKNAAAATPTKRNGITHPTAKAAFQQPLSYPAGPGAADGGGVGGAFANDSWLSAVETPGFPVCLAQECQTEPAEFLQSDDEEEVQATVFEDPVALRSFDVARARMKTVHPKECVDLPLSLRFGLPQGTVSGRGSKKKRGGADDVGTAARVMDELHLAEYKTRLLSRGVTHEALMSLSSTELKAVGLTSPASRYRLMQYRKTHTTRKDFQQRLFSQGNCVMCQGKADRKCMPCGHTAVCMQCQKSYLSQTCPVCRKNIASVVPANAAHSTS